MFSCIVGPYVFTLYVMFHLNVGDNNDDVYALRDVTDVDYDTFTRATFHKAL